MAFTVGDYLRNQVMPKQKNLVMNVRDMVILEGQVAKSGRSGGTQLLQLEATLDATTRTMPVKLYNASDDGVRSEEPYGSFCVVFEDASSWQREWARVEHLVTGQIRTLQSLATEGKASKITRNMAYTLFKNVVDYSERYRGMQSVIINGYEGSAEVTLSTEEAGIWHTPPHWIDSVAHLAGLIVNGSDASNTADYFYVTPGWESMRFIKPLEAGASYRNYVKMIPTEEKGTWAGDVYILQGNTVVGMVGQITFRQFPRLLIDRFFSPNKAGHQPQAKPKVVQFETVKPSEEPPAAPPAPRETTQKLPAPVESKVVEPKVEAKPAEPAAPEKQESTMISGVMDMIASETGLDRSELRDDTAFASIGVDSLMSLVLVEKFKAQLKLDTKSSLFLECPTIEEFKEWLEENR